MYPGGGYYAVQWLDAWARADALMSTDFNHTGKSMRKWSLGSLAYRPPAAKHGRQGQQKEYLEEEGDDPPSTGRR
jgi:hypothetical protein